MTKAILSIGSNIGNRLNWLQLAIDGLANTIVSLSGVYESPAWGRVDQGPFLNTTILVVNPHYGPYEWLQQAQYLEDRAGRIRGQRWGPRTLDIDVISCYHQDNQESLTHTQEIVMHTPDLILPHPLAYCRAFVLQPWLEIDPQATLIVNHRRYRVRDLLEELPVNDRNRLSLTKYVLRHPCTHANHLEVS